MGFGEKWIRWIWWCISTASFLVMINGTPTGFFQSSRGLRQGNPFSPYLFVIAVEVFSVFIKRAVEGDFLSGCRVKGRSEEGVLISHLLFADDTLVFCKPSQDQLTYLSWLLMWFEVASGLRINLEKSELIPVGRVESMDDLAGEFGCSLGSLPTTYLGMPLGAPFKSVTVWDGVEERFRRSSVRRRLEKIQRDFLWGGGNLEHKPHLVRWELVCLSKAKGGLGVKSLSLLNKTLLAKWNWCLANEREALWNQVIRGSMEKLEGDGARGKAFNDWEVEEAERFMERIQSKRVIEDVEDTVSWTETKSGKFSVKSLYIALEAGGSSLFPLSFIWNANVQPKISFFAWEATWGKALTLDLVQKRGWALANRCFMCLEKEETINHLLLHCSRTRALWDLLFALFGVSWVLPFSVRETLLSWNGFFMGKNRKKVWRAAPLHIFWTVWKERNRLTFKDESVSIQRLKHSFILTLWAEAKLFIDNCPLTIANFIDGWVLRQRLVTPTNTQLLLGSIEAVRQALQVLPQDNVALKFLLQATGDISASDIDLAVASKAIVIGFNVRAPGSVKSYADTKGVEIRLYKVIYDLIDDVRNAMEGLLDAVEFKATSFWQEEITIGTAEVRATFTSGSGRIAGCMVKEGKVEKGCGIRVVRDGRAVYVGTLDSLRRVKEIVKEVNAGLECGMGMEDYNDWEVGDIVQAFNKKQKKRTLEEASASMTAALEVAGIEK
ncbi:Translation initiation factor IF-2, chloroplastic [Vitis vinifera]|uniref:Translation initiation factor IF-2, chloroplastic n=1 Tax=Vitis vinifera TaxID=29760 RepID=A0A438DNM3_VITVI|nr:Translation initiation factor IF-2, chloroplastic [Vitis vinifera]